MEIMFEIYVIIFQDRLRDELVRDHLPILVDLQEEVRQILVVEAGVVLTQDQAPTLVQIQVFPHEEVPEEVQVDDHDEDLVLETNHLSSEIYELTLLLKR